MPLISVIVPVYNAEKTIERCVNSIRNQSFADLEIILVDDGATDGSGVLCDKLAELDHRVQVCHKENGGVSSARNRGMELATGTYIQFVDGDDYLPDFFCSALVAAQNRYGKEVFVWTSLQIVSETGVVAESKIIYDDIPCSNADRRDVLKLSARYLLNSPVNKLYHTDIVRSAGLRMNEDTSIAEDLLFNLDYFAAAGNCHVVILNQVPYFYVRNGEVSLDHGYRQNYYKNNKDVLKKLWDCAECWKAPKEDISLFYSRYWEYMQAAFCNLDRRDCTLSSKEIQREKGRILRDVFFQKSLKMQKENLGRGSYLAMRSRSAFILMIYETLVRARNRHAV